MCLPSAKTKHANKIGVSKKMLLLVCVHLLTFELIKKFIFYQSPLVAELVVCCIPYECFPVFFLCHSIWDCQFCHYELAHALWVFPESHQLLRTYYLVTCPNYLMYDVTYSANVAFILRVQSIYFLFFALHSSLVAFPPLSLQIVPCQIPSIVLATVECAFLSL